MSIIAFLLRYKEYVIMAILVAVIASLGVYNKILNSEISTLQAEKKSIKTQLEASQATVMQLKNDINEQNDAIQQLKTEAEERQKKNAEELKKAEIISEKFKKQAKDLLNRKLPTGVPACVAADSLINEEINNAKK